MKRIASLFCTVLTLLSICTIPASAHEECSFSKNHVPYKVTFSNSIDEHDAAIVAKHAFLASNIQPKAILSYKYMEDGSAECVGEPTEDEFFARIVTNIVTLPAGAQVENLKGVSGEITQSTEWDVSATASFPIKVVEAEVKGQHKTTETITISASDEWTIRYTEPGTYKATWYMIGYTYPVYGNCRMTATDSNDGKVDYMLMGYVTFPTTGVNVHITKK